ncbi:MAG TPA: helix-turn-helix domain-containing protein [Longimicrobium sp.]|jgi:putative transcriptional regulator
MRDDLFEELLESVRQAGAIMRGEMEPARVFDPDDIDVAELRGRFGLSQPRFAAMLGISVGTLRNWEQGRRRPDGPAQVLLRVADRNPEVVLEAAASAAAEPVRDKQSRPSRAKRPPPL